MVVNVVYADTSNNPTYNKCRLFLVFCHARE